LQKDIFFKNKKPQPEQLWLKNYLVMKTKPFA